MPRVKIGRAPPERRRLGAEMALRGDLAAAALRVRWQNVFKRPPPHLPRHILFRMLAYRLQADHLGDLDGERRGLLDGTVSPEAAGKRAVDASRMTADVRPGTMLAREWNGRMQRVA